ncbi:MAG: diadenylate cyclase [Desulfosudaceae bacterium]
MNTYILFRLYVLFRGTQVMRVAAGLVLLYLFQRVATQLGLVVTSWVMQGITAAAALIIIIVFRNEIRNVLQAKNIKAIIWSLPKKNTSTPVDVLAESVSKLSRRRIGALIVVPGKEDIRDLVHGGVEWQGLISKEMLLSIFWNGNPVHDGAVVIEGSRVTRVGAILPLSQRQDIPVRFGTRHRAALGLAQNSDALVIVVSEETGNIILAKGNEIIDIHDIQVLRHNLRRHFGMDREPIKGGRRETMELAAVGLVCLICMTGVWFSFARAMETLRTVEVPVEFANRGADLYIYGTSASSINLYLIGAGALIKNIRLDQLAVSVDLEGARIGENTFHLSRKNVILPPGIRLNRMEPTVLRVNLDKLTAKKVPVQIKWVGRLPEGKRIISASPSPSTIRLAGPSQELEAADTVYTEDVDIGDFRTSGTFSTRLLLDPPSLQVDETEGERIEVKYTIGERKPL